MSIYKTKFNPFTKKLQFVTDTSSIEGLHFKNGVATYTSLPLTGNAKNDARITNDTHHLYIWSLTESSGELSDWIDQGDIIDINWESIEGKPDSTPNQIDNIVDKGIISEASNGYKKVTKIQYNPDTGDLKIEYEI
ncbi:MAG: hypothetical protein R6U15_07625 [Candidatus Izemoplasmatales bacterium]